MLEGWGLYLLFSLPALLLGWWAQLRTKSLLQRNARIRTARAITGAQVARQVLDGNGLYEVQVERVGGFLSDHYDPRTKTGYSLRAWRTTQSAMYCRNSWCWGRPSGVREVMMPVRGPGTSQLWMRYSSRRSASGLSSKLRSTCKESKTMRFACISSALARRLASSR